MPEISRFFGIVISMYFDDHNPPHFHAHYAGKEAIVDIAKAKIIRGNLPKRERYLVKAWTLDNQMKLLKMWDEKKIRKIKGL